MKGQPKKNSFPYRLSVKTSFSRAMLLFSFSFPLQNLHECAGSRPSFLLLSYIPFHSSLGRGLRHLSHSKTGRISSFFPPAAVSGGEKERIRREDVGIRCFPQQMCQLEAIIEQTWIMARNSEATNQNKLAFANSGRHASFDASRVRGKST